MKRRDRIAIKAMQSIISTLPEFLNNYGNDVFFDGGYDDLPRNYKAWKYSSDEDDVISETLETIESISELSYMMADAMIKHGKRGDK